MSVNFNRLKAFKRAESYFFSIPIYTSGLIIISDAFLLKLLILFEIVVCAQYIEKHNAVFPFSPLPASIILENKSM